MKRVIFVLIISLYLYADSNYLYDKNYKQNDFKKLWFTDIKVQDPNTVFGNYCVLSHQSNTNVGVATAVLLLNTPFLIEAYANEETDRIKNLPKEFRTLNITTKK